MRALIQRVSQAEVTVDGRVVGACGNGLLVLLGVGENDTREEADALWAKISTLRIFTDENGKTNLSLLDVGGEVCIVSQFTLYANTRKGRRPSFTESAPPELAEELYDYFCTIAKRDVSHVGRGVFGAEMQVALTNDGPFTIYLDTDDFKIPRRQS